MDWITDNLEWMYWTRASGIAFGGLLLVLAGMTVWDVYSPSPMRKGWLPMPTTRGDRLFISIVTLIGIHLVWLGVFGAGTLWPATAAAVVAVVVLARWG